MKNLSNLLSVTVVVFFLHGFNSSLSFEKDWESVDENILLEWLEESNWVFHDVKSVRETSIVPGSGINLFAGWESSLELLKSSNSGNNSTN